MTSARQLKSAIIGLVGFAATEEQVLIAGSPPDEPGSPQNWAALPVVAHNTEFKAQQVQRLLAISLSRVPQDFGEAGRPLATPVRGDQGGAPGSERRNARPARPRLGTS